MSWKKRLEFVRDTHLASLHPDLQKSRKDLECSHCGHYHGEIWATARKMNLTVISNAVVENGGNQVKVVLVCDWCARNNSRAMAYERALAKAAQLQESIRLREIKKYYPRGRMPRERKIV